LQFTDFENTAFVAFIILMTRTILALNLNLLIDISKVIENMERAQCRNACLNQKFYFRQNLHEKGKSDIVEMSIDEIINGNQKFKGLIAYIDEYLSGEKKNGLLNAETSDQLDSYLKIFRLRANGKLLTPATWIRRFVEKHDKYNHDSKINEEINYDLMWAIYQIQTDKLKYSELIFD
jgi:glutamate--cysteine ligase catalytic subunit